MPTYHLHVPHGYTVRDGHSRSPSRGYSGSYHSDARVHDRPYHSTTQHDLSRYLTSSGRGSRYYDSNGHRRHHDTSYGGYSAPSRSSHAYSDARHSQPVYYTHSAHTHHSRSPSHRRSYSQPRDTGRRHNTLVAPRYTDAGRPQYERDRGHHVHGRRYSDSTSGSWLAEQFRRLFSGSGAQHRSRSRSRGGYEFVDPHTGRSVDHRGRHIYSV